MNGYEIVHDPVGQQHYNFVRDDMMYVKNADWDPDGDEGEGDTIGRTMKAGRIYKYVKYFEAIQSCWIRMIRRGKKEFLFGWRSNRDRTRMDMSRDHLINTIMMFHWYGGAMMVDKFYQMIPWRFSFGFKQTVDLYLWAKTLTGRKWTRHAYYWWQIPQSLIIGIWAKIAKLILRVGPELTQSEFIRLRKDLKARHKRLKRLWWLIPPVYADLGRAEMLECMPDSIGRRILRKILLWNTSRYNHVIKLLLGSKKVTKEDVMNYQSMTNGRWSTSLDVRTKRDIKFRKPEESKANRLDKDYLVFLFKKSQTT